MKVCRDESEFSMYHASLDGANDRGSRKHGQRYLTSTKGRDMSMNRTHLSIHL